jgi:hypothetical protein
MKRTILLSMAIAVALAFMHVPCQSQEQEKGRICGQVTDTVTGKAPRGNTFFIAYRLNTEGQLERVWGHSLSDGEDYYCLWLSYGSYIIEAWGENYEHLGFKSFWGKDGKVTHWSNPSLDVVTISGENDWFYLPIDLKPLSCYVYDVEISPDRLPSAGGTVTISFKVYSELGYPVLAWPTIGEFWKQMATAKKARNGSMLTFSFSVPGSASNSALKIGIGAGKSPNPQLNFLFKREVGEIQKGEIPPLNPR